MQLAVFWHRDCGRTLGLVDGEEVVALGPPGTTLTSVLEAPDVPAAVAALQRRTRFPLAQVTLLAPIDRHEVWAAGVTYRRSKVARMEESRGAAVFYDLVYEAPRPELFFKANPHRVTGTHALLRIRSDATWNVPEPELALVLNAELKLVGCTIGNDMSSRDIEGANPLYLPQAKVYSGCCALGPWITLAGDMPPLAETGIRISIERDGGQVFSGNTALDQMARSFEELIGWLGRDNGFPDGVVLLTGTGIVPGDDFTLQAGDVVQIEIDGIGTLVNTIVQGTSGPPACRCRRCTS